MCSRNPEEGNISLSDGGNGQILTEEEIFELDLKWQEMFSYVKIKSGKCKSKFAAL